ncbi:tyrosine-type recombinase/integrase [Pseudobacteriovorax antillogorgiicola]|uniref:Phage integrase family protein n=1 Tax=Pseudobacteriovorax antillogorgiicola TaxID=1513793 RepID=A0A1Y6CUH7_9BACT|nr:tyrosine-type recombinase/integrase [Pseudobacteriovorax antillogorgiicola]TCS44206.1 phage integrase family protein [Pseudobacteriovorax antillogorgiicola]SMF80395.1 Phage integrase family protein [Pseudobacteriovorax antillogorgiicola]
MSNFNQNHPKLGSQIKVDPIRSLSNITKIKSLLQDSPRDLALFTLGINSALRASDLLEIPVGKVESLGVGDSFEIREKKTGKLRHVTMNESVLDALTKYLAVRRSTSKKEPLFLSRKGSSSGLTVQSLHRLVKGWCHEIGLRGNYGSHTLRKTFGYHQRVTFKTELPILMVAFNHSSQKQTLSYLGIQDSEVEAAFMNSL